MSNPLPRKLSRCLITLFVVCLTWLAVGQPLHIAYATDKQGQATDAKIYLPLINKANSNATPNAPAPTATGQPVPAARLALFVDPTWKTSNASSALDAQGGQHVAFYYYESNIENRPTHAVYAYCPSQCDKAAAWKSVAFAQLVHEVQLKLTPTGKPRLLISAESTLYTGGKDYFYAACDGDCTQREQWTLTNFASGKVPGTALNNDDELPQRAFALDAAGRPRFVYYDENQAVQPNHFGLFYTFCDSHCADKTQWHETLLTIVRWEPRFAMERVSHPSLAFTPDGKPRIASAEFFSIGDGDPTLVYFACDEACDDSANWQKVPLYVRGAGAEPSVDLAIDANGRPRVAFYQEALLNEQGKRLFYAWCNDNCLVAASWQQLDLGLGSMNGQEPDLVLDQQGRPRIAYADWTGGGVGYAWCNEQCDSTSAQWEHKAIETGDQLQAAWNVPFPRDHCDAGVWTSLTPVLVLPTVGNPQIAYDADYHARCFYDDNPNDNTPPDWHYELVMRAVRLISFTQPFNLPDDAPTPAPSTTATDVATQTPVVTPTPTEMTPTPTQVTPTPIALTQKFALFAESQAKTSNASIAVDANGGQHMAFYYMDTQNTERATSAVYRYCANACENAANWQGVAFTENVNEVQLKLDPAGKPRLLIRTASAPGSDGNDYYYAACDDNCTQESGWSLVGITSATGGAKYEQHDAEQPQRSFALDPAGRPRFVYLDDNSTVDPLHVGVYYAFCDSDCTDQTQWQETRITELVQWDGKIENQERALYLSLAFTPDGRPRLITAEFYPLEGKAAELTYFECDSSCDLGYVWAKVKLYARGEGPLPSADLAIDADGHPHVAFYQEKIDDVGVQRQHLWYATCKETNCMTPMNWNARAMAFDARNGGAPDLALDAQGRPRIAYTYGEHGGIGYSWCDANCESYAGQWQHSVIENGAQLQTVLPISYPANCDGGGWTGLTPTLVLPATDDPQVAYDATYYAHCLSDDNPNDTTPPTWHDEVLMRAARLVVFTQP